MLEQSTEELRRSICKKLNNTLEKVQQDVQGLQHWIETQPHLPNCSSNTLLTCFLINSKNNLEQAKQKIDNYYSARGKVPVIFSLRDPLEGRLQEANKELCLYYLPKITPDGCRVLMGSFATGNTNCCDMKSVLRKSFMMVDVHLNREAFVRGTHVVFDATNVSFFHATKLTPSICLDLVYCLQGVFPRSIKGLTFINASRAVVFIMNILKPLMKKKLRQRVHVFSEGAEVLDQFFPKEMLPSDYGGKEASSEILNDEWFDCLKKNRDWFLNEGSVTTDEEKRARQNSKLLETNHVLSPEKEGDKSFKNMELD